MENKEISIFSPNRRYIRHMFLVPSLNADLLRPLQGAIKPLSFPSQTGATLRSLPIERAAQADKQYHISSGGIISLLVLHRTSKLCGDLK